jgi:nicotinate-nucleotide adenylyltransferase
MAKVLKIGVLGGSFNPPHMGHLQIFLHAMSIRDLDMIQVVPTVNHPFQKDLIAYEHRYQMTHLAFNNVFGMTAYVQQEKDDGKDSYMIDTLRKSLLTWGENTELTLIIGSDVGKELDNWKGIEQIRETVKEILIIPRNEGLFSGTSSSHARYMLDPNTLLVRSPDEAETRRICLESDVPKKVIEYIREHNLYEGETK